MSRTPMNCSRIQCAAALTSTLLLATACGGLPLEPASSVQTDPIAGYVLPRTPGAGRSLVYVIRPLPSARPERFEVFVDRQARAAEVGSTLGREYIWFEAAPGHHTVYSKGGNLASIRFEARAGDVVYLEQRAEPGVVRPSSTLRRIDAATAQYQLRYHASLGTLHAED